MEEKAAAVSPKIFPASSPKRPPRTLRSHFGKYLTIVVGAVIAAAGLEIFLIPNQIIDGGVVGVSIMMSAVTGMPLGVFLVGLNLPFLYIGYRQLGRSFVVATAVAILCLSLWSEVFAPLPRITEDFFLAAIFGGIIDGIGVGLIMRAGGSLDGTGIAGRCFPWAKWSCSSICSSFRPRDFSLAGIKPCILSWPILSSPR